MTDVVERAESVLADVFTPGPWLVEDGFDTFDGRRIWHDDGTPGVMYVCQGVWQGRDDGLGDANFIAESRTLVPELVAEVKRLRAQVAGVRELADEMLKEHGQSWNSISGRRVRGALEAAR